MIHYKFLITGEKGLKVSKASVQATIKKYESHETISHFLDLFNRLFDGLFVS